MSVRPARLIASLAALSLSGSFAVAEQLPVEAFASLPNVSYVQLSPDGKFLAALVKISENGAIVGAAVQIVDVASETGYPLAYARTEEFKINWIRWASNRYVLVSARYPTRRYNIDTMETRLAAADTKTRDLRSVLPPGYLDRQNWIPQFQDDVVDLLPGEEDYILLAGNFKSPSISRVIKVALGKNSVRNVVRDRPGVVGWTTDRQSRVRIAVHRDQTTYSVRHRAADANNWDTLWEFEAFSADQVWPLGFGKDPQTLYVRAYHDGRYAVFRVDLGDPDLEKELVFSDPVYDVDGGLIYSKLSGDVIGIRYSTDGGFTFWSDEHRRLQQAINDALPDSVNILYGLSDDERRYVVLSTSDTEPGTYYIGDRDQKRLMQVATRYPALSRDNLAEKRNVDYEARDGLSIEGFLTLPRDSGERPFPTVIFPHGGPISFDDGGFDYWTQFFANSGYAVLQMNFRGSAGYGYDFMKSGLQSWGLEMQNDVEDGTRWLIAEGIADPDRICVVGASYGGYAALMEAARNPDLYRCVVSFAGVTDVAYLVNSHRRFTNYEIVKEQIGSDRKELRQRSPVNLAESIDIPVLLAHGTDDRRVDVQHSRKMRRALERNGKDVQYIEFEEGDHFLSHEAHRIELFRQMDAFLQHYLGGSGAGAAQNP